MNRESSRSEAAVQQLAFLEEEPARLGAGKDEAGRTAKGPVYILIGAGMLWTAMGFGLALYFS